MRPTTLSGVALFAARVTMGLFFLYEAAGQIAKGWLGGDGLHHMLQSALDDNAIPAPYRAFLEEAVLPHTDHVISAAIVDTTIEFLLRHLND